MDELIRRQVAQHKINAIIDEFETIMKDIRERHVNDSVCGLCEYDGAFIGQSGNWCHECPGFYRDDCFKLKDQYREEWAGSIKNLPPVQPKHGTWIPVTNGRGGHECDQCHNYAPSYQNGKEHLSDFCPHCGADMRTKKKRIAVMKEPTFDPDDGSM